MMDWNELHAAYRNAASACRDGEAYDYAVRLADLARAEGYPRTAQAWSATARDLLDTLTSRTN